MLAQLLSQEWATVWTAIAAAAATVTALVTIAYTYFTLRLVRAQGEPKVIVYVKHDLDRPTVLAIVIENIGRDIAEDVSFVASRPIPRAWGVESPSPDGVKIIDDGPLNTGIPALGPNDPRTITWGQYGGLSKALGNNPITLKYTYKHGRRRFSGVTQLEVESYVGTDAHDKPSVVVARSIKEIETIMKNISTAMSKLASK